MKMDDKDLISQQEARDAVEAAHLAFKTVAKFDQTKIDRICEAMANVALRGIGASRARWRTKKRVSAMRRINAKKIVLRRKMFGIISAI